MSSFGGFEEATPHEMVEDSEQPAAMNAVEVLPERRSLGLEDLISQILAGTLPRYRELKPWEPAKLNSRHLEFVFARVSGLRNNQIAEFYGYTDSQVSIVLGHPDAQYLMARIQAKTADNASDILTKLEALAPLAVETLSEVLLEAKPETRAKVGFGILDRLGYGKKEEKKVTHEITLPAKQVDLLTRALSESQEIEDANYVIVQTPSGGASDGSDGGNVGPDAGKVPPTGTLQSNSEAAA